MTFEWKPEFAIGNRLIDEEHKVLIGLIGRFELSLLEKDGQKLAREALQGLNDYVHVHFMVEEELMKAYEYPAIAEHKLAHVQFRNSVDQYNLAFQESEMLMVHLLITYLKKWLTAHILKDDRALCEFLGKNGMH